MKKGSIFQLTENNFEKKNNQSIHFISIKYFLISSLNNYGFRLQIKINLRLLSN